MEVSRKNIQLFYNEGVVHIEKSKSILNEYIRYVKQQIKKFVMSISVSLTK